jgi:hypothetical protein
MQALVQAKPSFERAQVGTTDLDALRAGHRFIRSAEDDAPDRGGGGLPARLARK